MLFSDIVEEVKNGSWVLTEKSPLIYQIITPKVKVQFFPEKTKKFLFAEKGRGNAAAYRVLLQMDSKMNIILFRSIPL